jgi:hypothetical protein
MLARCSNGIGQNLISGCLFQYRFELAGTSGPTRMASEVVNEAFVVALPRSARRSSRVLGFEDPVESNRF